MRSGANGHATRAKINFKNRSSETNLMAPSQNATIVIAHSPGGNIGVPWEQTLRPRVSLHEVVLCGSPNQTIHLSRGTRPAGHNAALRATCSQAFACTAFIDRVSAVEERDPSSSSWRLARQQRSARQGCCGRRPPPILPPREGQGALWKRAGELCKEPSGTAAGRSKRLRVAPNGVRDAPARAFGDSPRVHAVR